MVARLEKFFLALTVLCVLYCPAFAHDEFVSDAEFDTCVKHCHKDVILNSDECWAIYQGRIGGAESQDAGFVLLIPDSRDPYYFSFRNVRLPYHTIEVSVDENTAMRFSCDILVCSPLVFEGEKILIDQMDKGEMLLIRGSEVSGKGDALIATVSLAGLN